MNETLTVSAAGLKLIQSFEGCEKPVKGRRGRFRAYVDPVGILTIGWGHTNATGRAFGADTVWTQAECDAALAEDLAKFEAGVRALVKVARRKRSATPPRRRGPQSRAPRTSGSGT
jgi:lysozyme